ncbi:MAG TPA: L-histidine N(alpha)-methyltransferase [Candidatus Sumerlaeota bacterium]|nr:L-histidine N(alpha)-methyltransferase [Candidatus Sumerlaeota bacterium]HOR28231.1 L-histidine N(alpha)-methyltransferase [Candidatus Sumerlaeota bacterium]HPK01155.1 L-histidine N(alpha)-methyltransferase [Candidatus Sumerlaeota bacterium]
MSTALLYAETEPFEDGRLAFLRDVLAGLGQRPRRLDCKYFYDEEGAGLFDAICELPEYYPTRTELAIMRENLDEIAECIGLDTTLIEYGSGNGRKTRLLLRQLDGRCTYVPLDIARQSLEAATRRLQADFPHLRIHPVCADFTQPCALPEPAFDAARRVVFFPGSTIGNFHPAEAERFLRRVRQTCGRNGGLLIGVDLKKDPGLLVPAYNDARGATARFNLNLLARINRELGADFDLDRFTHYAFYNPQAGRIEMHLASLASQIVQVGGRSFRFNLGDTIWTESSYKYTIDEFAAMALHAGLRLDQVWLDDDHLFSVHFYRGL